MSLPASITITQTGLAVPVTLVDGAVPAPTAGLPPYPLSPVPGATYYLTLVNGALAWVQGGASPLTVSAPSTGSVGVALAITGTVTPPDDNVVVGLSLSAIEPPATLVAATNIGGALSAELTPTSAGTFYVWAFDTTNGQNTAISGAVTITAASAALSITSPGTASYAAGSGAVELSGMVTPAQTLSLQVALSTADTAPPSAGWVAATLNAGAWRAAVPVPAAAGQYYVWVETTDGLVVAVSSFTIGVV
ncbi:hypothetical protein [Acidocella sp.]|uniref:hypothetical protein n=1 Tax=Acidocella sp. TaxID=50710 RepID=UPI0026087FBB|nr:hypothetical protein [Acidocella sp.]